MGWGTPGLSTLDSGSSSNGTGQGIVGNRCILRCQDPYIPERVKARQLASYSQPRYPVCLDPLGSECSSVTALHTCPHYNLSEAWRSLYSELKTDTPGGSCWSPLWFYIRSKFKSQLCVALGKALCLICAYLERTVPDRWCGQHVPSAYRSQRGPDKWQLLVIETLQGIRLPHLFISPL